MSEDIKEFLCGAVTIALFVVLGWLFCAATPSQLIGESDWSQAARIAAGEVAK